MLRKSVFLAFLRLVSSPHLLPLLPHVSPAPPTSSLLSRVYRAPREPAEGFLFPPKLCDHTSQAQRFVRVDPVLPPCCPKKQEGQRKGNGKIPRVFRPLRGQWRLTTSPDSRCRCVFSSGKSCSVGSIADFVNGSPLVSFFVVPSGS